MTRKHANPIAEVHAPLSCPQFFGIILYCCVYNCYKNSTNKIRSCHGFPDQRRLQKVTFSGCFLLHSYIVTLLSLLRINLLVAGRFDYLDVLFCLLHLDVKNKTRPYERFFLVKSYRRFASIISERMILFISNQRSLALGLQSSERSLPKKRRNIEMLNICYKWISSHRNSIRRRMTILWKESGDLSQGVFKQT